MSAYKYVTSHIVSTRQYAVFIANSPTLCKISSKTKHEDQLSCYNFLSWILSLVPSRRMWALKHRKHSYIVQLGVLSAARESDFKRNLRCRSYWKSFFHSYNSLTKEEAIAKAVTASSKPGLYPSVQHKSKKTRARVSVPLTISRRCFW